MTRLNVSARIAELAGKRRAHTLTTIERRELEKLEERTRTLVDWVAEPTDAYGDVIDPLTYENEAAARNDVAEILADFPEAIYVDVARVSLTGNALDGVTAREYDYKARYYRDGRIVGLRTRNEIPEEV